MADMRERDKCGWCFGTKKEACPVCKGDGCSDCDKGMILCFTCKGTGVDEPTEEDILEEIERRELSLVPKRRGTKPGERRGALLKGRKKKLEYEPIVGDATEYAIGKE
jgi:hypothetical protein